MNRELKSLRHLDQKLFTSSYLHWGKTVELDKALDQSGTWSDFIDIGLVLFSY